MLASDVDAFDCDTCPVAEAFAALWPENAEAWSTFNRCTSRYLCEMHAVNVSLQKEAEGLDLDAWHDLTARLSIIFDILHPPKTT